MNKLLDNILQFNEDKFNKIKNLLSPDDEYSIDFIKSNIAEISGKKTSIIIEYSVLGCYNTASSIWTWAWKMVFLDKSLAYDSLAIKYYKNKIKQITAESYKEENILDKYLYYCNNGYFFIYYKFISEIIKFGLYLTQGEWIFPNIIDNNGVKIIEFLIAKKILQYKQIEN